MMVHASAQLQSWTFRPPWPAKPRAKARVRATVTNASESGRLNAAVLAVARQRDRKAFQDLFDHFAPRVKGYLMRQGAANAVAEDLAQEALLAVWRKAALFDPAKASASTWIFTIARNLRIDAIRKERRPELDANDPALQPSADREVGETMDWAQAEDRLRAALANLPLEQARIIELSFLAEKPHSTIAIELGLPLGTVKSRIRLAMARLRLALGDGT